MITEKQIETLQTYLTPAACAMLKQNACERGKYDEASFWRDVSIAAERVLAEKEAGND